MTVLSAARSTYARRASATSRSCRRVFRLFRRSRCEWPFPGQSLARLIHFCTVFEFGVGMGQSYLRISKRMATNLKNGVLGGMAARGGSGGGCRGARGPISRGFGTSPHSFPQPTITRKAQTNRRGGARPTPSACALRAGPCAQGNFCVFQGARALWRPPRGRCAAAFRPQNGRKTGPQRAQTVPRRCGVGQTRKRVCDPLSRCCLRDRTWTADRRS